MTYHTVILVGNLGRDPEMRYTPEGQAVTNFSVAVNDNYTTKAGGKVERTMWVRVSTWGKLAENCNQYLKKGKKVLVEGRLIYDSKTGSPRIWDHQDGSPGTSFEVSANTVRFLSGKDEAGGEAAAEPAGEQTAEGGDSSDDIPF